MGKATRWFKGLLGMKKDKENIDHSNFADRRENKKRWSFANPTPQNPANENACLRSYISDSYNQQNNHAIAVAAATAAAADAAVAAAEAAVAVVRLTSKNRGAMFAGGRERFAATKIQSVFRGFLSRKALRALKGLVKLQALVRGYLVRKRAAATFHSMQALIRAQAAVRSQRARRSFNKDRCFAPDIRARKSIERFDDPRSEYHNSKRLSSNLYETSFNSTFEDSPKIVEIDTFKPKSRSRRNNTGTSDSGEDPYYQNISSPLPCPIPGRLSIPDSRHYQDYDWIFNGDECRFSTAQSTPRFANCNRSNAPVTPAKSACGDGDTIFRPYPNSPSYMANTRSFTAKLRSHSAPKQRPGSDPGSGLGSVLGSGPGSGPKKRLSLNEIMASRTSLSGVRMQRSCARVQEGLNL